MRRLKLPFKVKNLRAKALLGIAALFLLASSYAAIVWPLRKTEDKLYLKEAAFADLPGWQTDALKDALVPLEKSCAVIAKKNPAADVGAGGFAGTAAAWAEACKKLPHNPEDARAFFEENFTPYEMYGSNGRDGLFTGYYEPLLHGSRYRHGRYAVPLYERPKNMFTANLGDFKPELKGQAIVGRIEGATFVPYYNRAEIDGGALKNHGRALVWVNSPVDAFFLQIQGSGQVKLDHGGIMRVGYSAQNGQPYTAIGRVLLAQGLLTKDNVSMQSIRAWLEAHPKETQDILNTDASYVFFRILKNEGGPLGAEGVPLTEERSMAVDRKKIPYGAPIFLSAEDPDNQNNGQDKRIERLMVAQDTGGAITGAVRGDFFWGAGEEAARKAGIMKSAGIAWILLPKSVTIPDDRQWKFWRWVF